MVGKKKSSRNNNIVRDNSGKKDFRRPPTAVDVNKTVKPDRAAEKADLPDGVLLGRNAVTEALKNTARVNKLLVAQGNQTGSLREIIALAHERKVPLDVVPREKIEALAPGYRHQGVLAYVSPVPYTELDDVLKNAATDEKDSLLILLDGIEDPHNLGAIIRSADAVGARGVIISRHHSVPINATVAKTSAGAVEYVPVARVGNISQAIKKLKDSGYWVAGADMDGECDYDEASFTGPIALVIGSEGHGISRLVKENCDFLVKLPMAGKINSLNASVAGAILMYEVVRQRKRRGK